MEKTVKLTILSLFFLLLSLLLQATLLEFIASVGGVKPDLSLIILIFIAFKTGSTYGLIYGFIVGLVQDFISLPPLGFFALIKASLGFSFGLLEGAFTMDPILLPILLVLAASLLKGIVVWVMASIFSISSLGLSYFGAKFWLEIVYNCLLTPLLFAFLNLFPIFNKKQNEGTL
jgi:rod shape-determining protein MreD